MRLLFEKDTESQKSFYVLLRSTISIVDDVHDYFNSYILRQAIIDWRIRGIIEVEETIKETDVAFMFDPLNSTLLRRCL